MEYVFETERLSARGFGADDALRLYENHLDAAVKRWMPNESYRSVEEARNAIAFYSDCVKRGKLPCVLAVTRKDTGELIGDAGINRVDGRPEELEVGFVIYRAHRGKGYATELLKAMTDYAFSTLQASALYGRVLRGNGASESVLRKNGYRFTAEEFGAEDDPYGNGMLVFMAEG